MTTFDLDFAADHFTLLGLPRLQRVDRQRLEAAYRDVQARVHPDKHAHAAESDQRLAMQWATRVNEAWQTLRSPLARGQYLLKLAGHDPGLESNTAMPAEFLMAQMELREAVAEAKAGADGTALDGLRGRLLAEMKDDYNRLEALLDDRRDFAAAGALVRQLMFQEKLLHEIDDALEAVTA